MTPYNIDWGDTGSMLGGIGSIIAALILIATYFKAKNSFAEWQRQERYKEDRKLAIDILAAFEDGKQSIASIRSPVSLASEQADVERRLFAAAEKENVTLSDNERAKHMMRLTVLSRIEHHNKSWERVFNLMPVAKAVFGTQIKDILFDIIKARQEIFAAAEMFRHNINAESRATYEGIIWKMSSNPKDDPIESKLIESEAELGRKLIPFIRPTKLSETRGPAPK